MTYALGRGVDYNDMPEIREIVAKAAADHYRFSDLDYGHCEEPGIPYEDQDRAGCCESGGKDARCYL